MHSQGHRQGGGGYKGIYTFYFPTFYFLIFKLCAFYYIVQGRIRTHTAVLANVATGIKRCHCVVKFEARINNDSSRVYL